LSSGILPSSKMRWIFPLGRAEARLDQILVANPGLPEAIRALAFLSLTEERLDDAAQHFGRLRNEPLYREEAFYYLGRIAETERRFQEAIRSYQRVIDGSHAVEAQLRAARIMFGELGDREGAVRHLRDFGVANPLHRSDLLVAQAQLLLQMDRLDEAMLAFDEALVDAPDDPALLAAHAQLYVILARDASERGELDRAESLLEQGLARYEGDTDLRYAQALLYQEQKRMRKSAGVLESLVEEHPDDATFLNALGYLLTDQFNRHEEARGYIQKALAINSDSAAIIDSMGWVLFNLGDYEAAVSYLERAYSLEPEGEIAAHLVDARWAVGDRVRALELLGAALEREPENRHLIEVGERLTR
jgi:tetratricopeptide (TPR) repeat protein